MQDLEERLERTEIRAELYEKNYEETMKTINSLKIGIQNIFERIGCDAESVGGATEVTEVNMM
jgi:chaperonin cofactor prefoldin